MRCFSLFPLLVLQVHCLWPIPRSLSTGSTTLKLAADFKINLNVSNPPQDLVDAISQTESYLSNDKLQRLAVGRGAADNATLTGARKIASLSVSLVKGAPVHPIATEAVKALTSREESYILSVPSDGSAASLTANSTLGLFRGLTTFSQLWYYYGGVTYSLEAPVEITDYPAYPYRGFMLDTARNYFPVDDIKRTLDAMSWVKMSTFHWHVVDSQSFPLEVAGFEELSQAGAYSTDQIYNASDVKDIIAYAGARGIDVLVEVDTPGHTASISASHPEHIACNDASPWGDYSAEPPAGQLRIASSATTNFTASLLGAVAKTLPSTMFSTGGDEVNLKCYTKDAQTQAELKKSGKTIEQALDTFTSATHGALVAEGKVPVVWEEMVLDFNVTLHKDTIVMVWISSANAKAVTEKNYRIVHAPSYYFYLDCGAGEWLGDDPTGNSWCDPFKTWQKSYTFNPLANLTTSQQKLVLGGQQLLWTEQSSAENLDSIVWPRAAASAEIFWTGDTLPSGGPLSGSTALPRLHDLRYRMVQRGVRAIPLQPQWCALRPGVCNLNS
ncbi:glycoside hydrolase family 20 protein [Athelia psychrophila]|uniref:Beta-hexosaminidase n=1 Tax=Athelia psychrophila TaxID=1759441 RepID=A0A166HW01_9AGAM|nr:glycoside hydrolase family 20 protein [Fibularhizoctonia sp. CBS 109695]